MGAAHHLRSGFLRIPRLPFAARAGLDHPDRRWRTDRRGEAGFLQPLAFRSLRRVYGRLAVLLARLAIPRPHAACLAIVAPSQDGGKRTALFPPLGDVERFPRPFSGAAARRRAASGRDHGAAAVPVPTRQFRIRRDLGLCAARARRVRLPSRLAGLAGLKPDKKRPASARSGPEFMTLGDWLGGHKSHSNNV